MTNAEKMAFIQMVCNVIFRSKTEGTDITREIIFHPNIISQIDGKHRGRGAHGRWFVNATLRGFDIDLNLGNKIAKLRFLEQNPTKRDLNGNLKPLANLAQQGHKIMWMIDRSKDKGFLGRLQDGQWVKAQQFAYTTYQNPGQTSSQDRGMNDAPVVPAETDIPEYVVQNTDYVPEVDIPNEYR